VLIPRCETLLKPPLPLTPNMSIRTPSPDGGPAESTPRQQSRRSVLRGVTLLGASAASGALFASQSQPAAAVPAFTRKAGSAAGHPGSHLVLNYQPSQPTGWGFGFTPSVGGHTVAREFTFQGTGYRISLILADPVYEDTPADPAVKFRQTLADSFGAYYSFRYHGGFTGRNEFSVESNNVWVNEQGPGILYGADLYVVYHPGHGDPHIRSNLQWIQVIRWPQGPPPGLSVDNFGRASPFYIAGGLTSINGDQVVTFADIPQKGVGLGGGGVILSDHFLTEIFLVQDTGIKNAAGKDIVNVFGGLKYGWQVKRS